MNYKNSRTQAVLFNNAFFQIVTFSSTVLLVSNLNAIIDHFLHPDIPYFDKEHLIVGGVTGLVTAILFGLVILYARHLERALRKIRKLESFLPICAHCKKIRISDSTPTTKESWQAIEYYIIEHSDARFSHGICPDCMKKHYPELAQEEKNGDNIST